MIEIKYSDVDFFFRKISSTGDINKVTNEAAINQSLMSLFNTTKGERLFNLEYGADIGDLLFEPLDTTTAERLADAVKLAVIIWEPRIELTELAIDVDYSNAAYEIYLEYQIINTINKGSIKFILRKI